MRDNHQRSRLSDDKPAQDARLTNLWSRCIHGHLLILGFVITSLGGGLGCDFAGSSEEFSDAGQSTDDTFLSESDAQACQRLDSGTSRLLDASTEATDAPSLTLPYSPHQIRLQPSEPDGFSGYLLWEPEQTGPYLIYVSPQGTLQSEQDGTMVEMPSPADVASCSALELLRYNATFSSEIVQFFLTHPSSPDMGFIIQRVE